jgi:hypothetical protein
LGLKFGEDGHFRVEIKSGQIQGLMKNLKSKLTLIKLYSPSLEEAYLKIIDQENSENT